MSDEMLEASIVDVQEHTVLEKFEGDPVPENLFERVHIENGEVTKVEKYENGELLSTEVVKEVE
jgi:hypothetical protein